MKSQQQSILSAKAWQQLVTKHHEDDLIKAVAKDAQHFYNSLPTDLAQSFSAVVVRYLMAENDLPEAVSLGLSIFHETPYYEDIDEDALTAYLAEKIRARLI